MTGPRIIVGAGTPPPSQRQAAAFRLLIEPEARNRPSWSVASCLGEVLDTRAPDVCVRRSWAYTAATGDFWINAYPCGSRTCPVCVVPSLTKTAGAAWAYWGGRYVSIVELDEKANRTARRAFGIRMQDHHDPATGEVDEPATAGALKVPGPGGMRTLFWTATSNTALRAQRLNRRLVEAIRAVPITEDNVTEREPSTNAGSIPSWRTLAEARDIVSIVGAQWRRFDEAKGGVAKGVTPEMKDAIREMLWDRARVHQ